MSEWTTMDGLTYHDSYTPDTDDITIERNCVDKFVNALICHHVHISVQLQRFYIANLLRHWVGLMEVLTSEPMG